MKWLLLPLLLVASAAAAQSPARQRQERRAALLATPTEPMLELYVAANHLTLAEFNAKLDPDSLVVDKTRFKWAEASDHFLMLEPFADLGQDEKLIVQVGFKDRFLPAKAVIAVVSRSGVVDGKVEVDRRANTPEALLAALTQREAELEELKARCVGNGPAGLMLSGWLNTKSYPVKLIVGSTAGDSHGLEVIEAGGHNGAFSTLVAVRLRNLPGQKPWVPKQASIADSAGASVEVLSVQMKQPELAPGEVEWVVLEARTLPWGAGETFNVVLIDTSGQRRLSINLQKG